jgi:hypothetical protein
VPSGGGGITNPLTANLLGAGFDIQNVGTNTSTTFYGVNVGTEFLTLPPVSLASRIEVGNALQINPVGGAATRFLVVPPECAIGPTGPDDLCNKAYVDSVAGAPAYGAFVFSASAPHGVDEWFENAATNWGFSNTGTQSNQDWLLALGSASQSGQTVFLTLVQGVLSQTVEVVSVVPDVGFTYIEYLSVAIPPGWVNGVETACYYSIAGPTGPAGPFSQALANKILVDEVADPAGGVVNLTWSTGDPPNIYVPYNDPPAPGSLNTTIAPVDPSTTGTGWRFAKTYNAESVSTAGTTLVSGNTYTIISQGNPVLNWNAMGAPVSHPNGTQFLYNGTAPVGGTITVGTAYASTKISWYALNALYGLSLPQSIVPSTAIKKKNLRNAWFLVKMNSDVALQGSFAIQIETYAYQFGGNTTNDYTGRWAYSLPLQQGVGFSAGSATNITTTLTTPRLRSGFTYLLYAGDISPAILPNAGLTFAQGGSGLFAPSQVSTENTLRDPYNLYVSTPHLGLTSSSYVANATQPAYGGSSPYTDQGDVEVASIYLNTSSTSPPVGVGQTTMDFNVMAFGYSGLVESSGTEQTFSYTTQWV